jgi:hypothetical protein
LLNYFKLLFFYMLISFLLLLLDSTSFKSLIFCQSNLLRVRLNIKTVQSIYYIQGIGCTIFIFYKFYLEILDFIVNYRFILLILCLILVYPWIHNKISKINYYIVSKFVKSPLPYNYPDKGSYVQLLGFCLFALIMLYFKYFLLYYYNDFMLTITNIFNIIPLIILSIIISADASYSISVLVFIFKQVIIIKLREIYTNIKLDPCYYISYKITILFSIKYALLIVILLFSFSWYESIISYLTFEYLFKFISSLKNIISDMSYNNIIRNRSYNRPLFIVTQSEEFKEQIFNELYRETRLSKEYLINNIKLSENDFEFIAGLMKINRVPRECFALAWDTERENSWVKVVHPDMLLHTKPLEGNKVSGLFQYVGLKSDLDNLIRSVETWTVFIYSASNGGSQRVYKLVDSIWHPKCQEGLFAVKIDLPNYPFGGFVRESYNSCYSGHGEKPLYFFNREASDHIILSWDSPKFSSIGVPLCKSENLALTACMPRGTMCSTKIGLDNRTFFKSLKPVIIEE